MRTNRGCGLKDGQNEKTTFQVSQLIADCPENREHAEKNPFNHEDERNAEQGIDGVQQSVVVMGRGIVEAVVNLQKRPQHEDQQQDHNYSDLDVRIQPEITLFEQVSTPGPDKSNLGENRRFSSLPAHDALHLVRQTPRKAPLEQYATTITQKEKRSDRSADSGMQLASVQVMRQNWHRRCGASLGRSRRSRISSDWRRTLALPKMLFIWLLRVFLLTPSSAVISSLDLPSRIRHARRDSAGVNP